jgi:hypothetical protein
MKHLSILLLLAASFASCENYKSKLIEKKACIVTSVEEFSPGQRNTMQVDYEWHAVTDCGMSFTSRKHIEVGDTIQVEYHKYVK